MSWARALFQSVVICPSTSLPLALRLDAGSPFSLSRSRARLSSMSQIASFRPLDHRLIGGEVAAVLGNLAQLVARSLDRVGGGGTSHEVGER